MNINSVCLHMAGYNVIVRVDRVGSEFWNQQVRIGNDLTGIK